jgi:hypothetical protein
MTPAKDKNAQYFAWDFVGRTIVSIFVLLSNKLNIVMGSLCHEEVMLCYAMLPDQVLRKSFDLPNT